MRRTVRVLVVAVLSIGLCCAQQDSSSGPQPQEKSSDQKEKEKRKQDKSQAEDASTPFSEAIANNLLNDLRDGLEGHSQRLLLSAFDQDKMEGYLSFEDQIQALFQRYDSFRVHYRITQSTVQGAKGVVLADFEMEEIPPSGGTPQRRQRQLKFEMERGRKGWKIVDFNPRGFFS
jgi:hypothetical protein